jgi:hypothetical protein
MRVVAVLVIAYVLTGLHYVWRDFRKPIDSQPGYIRWGGGIRPKLFIVLCWLPGTLSSAFRGGDLRRQAVPWAIFAALTVAGLYFSSI